MIDMKRNLLFSCLILFLVQWTGNGLYAQAEPDRGLLLDEEKWELWAGEMDFTPPTQEFEKKDEAARSSKIERERRWASVLKVLAILAAVGIIVLILRYLLAGEALFSPKNKKIEKEVQINLENIESNLPEADLPVFIDKALEGGDFKMAVRLHYLALIQALAQKEWIEWQPEKTNGDYMQEMQDRPVFDQFGTLTRVFERIWYGDYPLEKEAYAQVAEQFALINNQISSPFSPAVASAKAGTPHPSL